MQMSTKKKVIAIAITTVALTASSFGIAEAGTKSSAKTVANSTTIGKPGRGAELAALLADLVAKGTITQAQADAITAAQTAADAARPQGPMGGPKGGFNGGPFGEKLTVISSTLGIDSATVVTRLKAGETLAAIAGTKKDALIAALVADETKKIDAAVTAGKLTAAQATTLKAGLTAHVTAEVEATAPAGGMMGGRGGKGGRGHGGPDGGQPGATAGTLNIPAAPGSAA